MRVRDEDRVGTNPREVPLLVLAEVAKQAKSVFFENECRVAGMRPRRFFDIAFGPVESDVHPVSIRGPGGLSAPGRGHSLSARLLHANGLPDRLLEGRDL